MMKIGDNIRKIREQRKLSQKEVAAAIEVAPTQYSRLENDKVIPSLQTLIKVAKVLEVHLDTLVYGQEEPWQEVEVKDKSLIEKIKLIEELPEEEKNTVLKVIDMAVTKMKFKHFFEQQLT